MGQLAECKPSITPHATPAVLDRRERESSYKLFSLHFFCAAQLRRFRARRLTLRAAFA